MPQQVDAEWSDTHGTLRVDGGSCVLDATAESLRLRIEADDEATLLRMRELITRNLARFSRREPLTVTWHRPDGPDEPVPVPPPTGTRRRRTVLLAAIGVLAIAAHVVLGGMVLAAPSWTGWTADVILVVVLVKGALIAL